MTRNGGSVYLIVRKSHRWTWRPKVSSNPATRLGIHWLGIYIGFPRSEEEWK